MRRVALATVSTVTGLVLLLSFKTHSLGAPSSTSAVVGTTGTTGSNDAATSAGSSGTAGSSTSSAAASSQPSASSAASTGSTSVTGDSVDTRWGPVQVQITVTGGKLTAVQAIDYPENNGRDVEINAYAIPALNQEALQAGSANIDVISGATYTSDGYIQSLQSALDKAGVA